VNALLDNGTTGSLMVTGQLGIFEPGETITGSITGVADVQGVVSYSNLSGYFIVGPTIAQVQATVYNERLGVTILSNVIQLEVRVPPSMDGTIFIENLNAIQRNALFGNIGSNPTIGVLPLGFRLRSNGFNLAAVLDGLTYLDINRVTGVMGHTFTVTDTGV
jgi:hypothetical protein